MEERVVQGIGCMVGQESIRPERLTIVFVHGAGGNHQMWIPQMEYVSARFNTIAINLPGHGLGERRGETTIEGYVEAVRDLLDGLEGPGLAKVVLAGLSMGGAITQAFALTYPDRLIGIILFSTGARLKVMPELFNIIRLDFEAYLKFLPQFAFAETTPAEVIEPVISEARKRDPELVYGDFQACDRFDVIERVKDISLPCLIFSGTEDKLTPPKYMDYLHEQIRGSRLIRLDNAGHMLNLEKVTEVNAAIQEFIESLSGGKA